MYNYLPYDDLLNNFAFIISVSPYGCGMLKITNKKHKKKMKKLLVTALSMMAAISMQAQETAYKITGTVPTTVTKVYLYVMGQRSAIDSAAVSNGKFEMNGKQNLNEILMLDADNESTACFNDGTPLNLNLVNNTITGSDLNKKLFECSLPLKKYDATTKEIYDEYEKVARDNSEAGKAKAKALAERFNMVRDSMLNDMLGIIKANKDNLIPAVYLSQIYTALDYNELKDLLNPSAPYYNHPALARVKQQLAAFEKRMPGKMFTDLTMNDTEGKQRKLSEWCGKGNYVLVDFWASWCGPCRQEMPNVVANYEKYHAKGFEVVGVSFDNNGDAWKAAIKNIGMKWPNISDLKGWKCAAAPAYGINAIPSNVLLDGEGKIVATDLRGEDLGEKLKEVYGF